MDLLAICSQTAPPFWSSRRTVPVVVATGAMKYLKPLPSTWKWPGLAGSAVTVTKAPSSQGMRPTCTRSAMASSSGDSAASAAMMPVATWFAALLSWLRLLVPSVLATEDFLAAGALSAALADFVSDLAAGFAAGLAAALVSGLASVLAGVCARARAGASSIRAEAIKDFMGGPAWKNSGMFTTERRPTRQTNGARQEEVCARYGGRAPAPASKSDSWRGRATCLQN